MSAPTSSAQSEPEEHKSAPVQSARALASAPSQSLAGIVESIVRPMLTTPTLTEEVQPYYVSRITSTSCDTSKLSDLARLWIATHLATEHEYDQVQAGVQIYGDDADDIADALARTTRHTHEDAVREELREFRAWLEYHLYATVGGDDGDDFDGPDIDPPAGATAKERAEFNARSYLREYSKDRCLFILFRASCSSALSHPAWVAVRDSSSVVVKEVLATQVWTLTPAQKKRALDDALTAAREEARKRRKVVIEVD